MNVNPSHAAGHAAYSRHTTPSQETPSQEAAQSPSTPESESTDSTNEPPSDTALQEGTDGTLTSQEQEMIEENFPEDPELSMRLYGRGQNTETVNPDAVGRNLDVTG